MFVKCIFSIVCVWGGVGCGLGAGEDSWGSLGQQGDQTSQSQRKSTLNIHWKDWCSSWSSNTLTTWYEELTHWESPWCWERLRAGGEGGDKGWDGWMASRTQWTWVWASSGSWWWIGKPGMLQSLGLQRVRHHWQNELNWILTTTSKKKMPRLMSKIIKTNKATKKMFNMMI